MNQVMIDFETLSTEKNAVVFALCVTIFNRYGIQEDRLFKIPTEEQVNSHIDEGTVSFWMKMPELYLELREDCPEALLPVVSDILEYIGEMPIWCNWVKSDGNWLDHLASYLSKDSIPHFRQYRCYATILQCFGNAILHDAPEYQGEGQPHHPTYDCNKQVHRLLQINEQLNYEMF